MIKTEHTDEAAIFILHFFFLNKEAIWTQNFTSNDQRLRQRKMEPLFILVDFGVIGLKYDQCTMNTGFGLGRK